MTDETEPEPTDDEQLNDVDNALESAGFVESDDGNEEPDDGGPVSGIADRLSEMTGTGKDLDAYENDPIASVFTDDGAETPRGAKHIARGVDGLSPFAAAHPLVDIGVGFVLLKAEGQIAGSPVTGEKDPTDPPGDDGDDSHYRGDMT